MLDFLLIVIGASGVAISIFAKFVYAQRSNEHDADVRSKMDALKRRKLFGKPGRHDTEPFADS
jgi:hypothetical protein